MKTLHAIWKFVRGLYFLFGRRCSHCGRTKAGHFGLDRLCELPVMPKSPDGFLAAFDDHRHIMGFRPMTELEREERARLEALEREKDTMSVTDCPGYFLGYDDFMCIRCGFPQEAHNKD